MIQTNLAFKNEEKFELGPEWNYEQVSEQIRIKLKTLNTGIFDSFLYGANYLWA